MSLVSTLQSELYLMVAVSLNVFDSGNIVGIIACMYAICEQIETVMLFVLCSRDKFGETLARVWWEQNRARIQKQYL